LCAADSTGVSADDESSAAAFAAAIQRFAVVDPHSPEAIETRLGFADFLAKAAGGNCALRLDRAQRQLESALASPAIDAVLPAGLARAAGVEYQIHAARASCVEPAVVREQELRAALESAQRAVSLYRDAFDAVSMVTMQFNTGVTYRSLGDDRAALAALQAAIDLDREYGFREDAKDNYQLLLQWNNQEAGPDKVAALMTDFPQRSAALKFGWFGSDADVSLEIDYTRIVGDEVSRSRVTKTVRRHVREHSGGLSVSYEPGAADYDVGTPPNGDTVFVQDFYLISLARLLLNFHDFDLARNGDFEKSTDAGKFNARVRAESAPLTRDVASKSDPALHLNRRIDEALRIASSPGGIEPLVAEDYNLETGTWIGARLEQGVWYTMTLPLPLPLAPQLFVSHKIEFAYTRSLPCTADSTDHSCIEIVLHAAPDAATLNQIARSLAPRGQLLRCSSATEMRLVTDPATLQPYLRDMRHHSFWSTGQKHSLIESEKTVFVGGRINRAE
jgi:tetratricopeptide (TPR) repeat protein